MNVNLRTVPFSPHAVSRYLERFEVSPPEDIEAHLREMLLRAKQTRTHAGAQRWVVDDVVFVISLKIGKVVTIMIAKNHGPDLFLEELRQESEDLRRELRAKVAGVPVSAPPSEDALLLAQNQQENARQVFDDLRRGKSVTPKAIRRAASVLGVAVPAGAELPPSETVRIERDRQNSARHVIADFKRGRHITPKALRNAAAILGVEVPVREPKSGRRS